MQICALDSADSLIFAKNASKHRNYQCLECKEKVRLRSGIHRQAHFYHVQPNRLCRQHAKGMPHLMTQHFLKNILPENEAELECQFSIIGRIADVAWHSRFLIFEIQCSPISAEEVNSRNRSYASLGYQVVWIFHDTSYNQFRLTSAENALLDHPHYFTDINALGEGKIYDQASLIAKGKRIKRLLPLSIDPTTPKSLKKHELKQCQKLPLALKRRTKEWPFIFSGDTVDTYLACSEDALILQIKDLVLRENGLPMYRFLKFFQNFAKKWIFRPYIAVFKLLLERACR